MSFSHLDKNITFDPHTEQLHVDGNKSLIYAHLAEMLRPTEIPFQARGTQGLRRRTARLTRAETTGAAQLRPGRARRQDIEKQACDARSRRAPAARSTCPFTVEQRRGHLQRRHADRRHRAERAGHQRRASHSLEIQCKGCDQHRGTTYTNPTTPTTGWIIVQEDYNQSNLYAQAGADGGGQLIHRRRSRTAQPVQWRALVATRTSRIYGSSASHPSTAVTMSHARSSDDEHRLHVGPGLDRRGYGEPRRRVAADAAAYDVANTDFFADLNKLHLGQARQVQASSTRAKVIAGEQSLSDFDTIALADDALPGNYSGRRARGLVRQAAQVGGGWRQPRCSRTARSRRCRELTNDRGEQVSVNPSTVYVGQVGFTSQSGDRARQRTR